MIRHDLTPAFKSLQEKEEDVKQQEWVDEMEEGGFTVVMPNMKSATDGVNSMKVQNKVTSVKELKLETNYMNKRKTKELEKSDFYKF